MGIYGGMLSMGDLKSMPPKVKSDTTQGPISFGDINEAIGLPRTKLRTLRGDNRCAHLESTPYINREAPKVSHWIGYGEDNSIPGFNGPVYCIEKQADGKILVGGSFTRYKDHYICVCIARLNSDLSFDYTFNPWSNSELLGYNGILGGSGISITRPNPESPDSKYGFVYVPLNSSRTGSPSMFGYFKPAYELNHGAVYNASSYSFFTQSRGSRHDPIYQPIGSSVHTIKINAANNKIYVGGHFTAYNGTPANSIIALDINGGIDTNFLSNIGIGFRSRVYGTTSWFNHDFYEDTAYILDINLDIPNTIIVTGDFYNYNNNDIFGICKLDITGMPDTIFNTNAVRGFRNKRYKNQDYYGRNIVISEYYSSNSYNYLIIVGGSFTYFNDATVNNIVCIKLDGYRYSGIQQTPFINIYVTGSGFNGEVKTLVKDSIGSIYAGGHFTTYNGTTCNKIVKLGISGNIDTSFNTGQGFITPTTIPSNLYDNNIFFVNKILMTQDGFLLVVGSFWFYNETSSNNIVAININGTRNTTFKVLDNFTGNTGGQFSSNMKSFKPYGYTWQTGDPALYYMPTTLITVMENSDNSFTVGGRFNLYAHSLTDNAIQTQHHPNYIIKLSNSSKVVSPIEMLFDPNYRIPIYTSTTTGDTTTITWIAPSSSTNTSSYSVYKNDVLIQTVPSTTLSLNVTGLIPDTKYVFRVTSTDTSGNISNISGYTSTKTLAVNDTTPPTTVSWKPNTNLTNTSVVVSWYASSDDTGVAYYEIYSDSILLATTDALTLNITALTQGTQYNLIIYAIDSSANYSTVSTTNTFTTTGTLAAIPTPSAVVWASNTNLNYNSVTLNWLTAPFEVDYYMIYNNGVLLLTVTGDVLTYNISGLTTATQYNYTIYAKDISENITPVSTTNTFTPVDTTAPSTPTSLTTSSITSTTVVLNWGAATDNVAVAYYYIYKNDGYLATTTQLTYQVTGLTVLTSYTFKVYSFDAAGNASSPSNIVSITTPDTTAPTAPTNLAGSSITETTATLTWSGSTDNVGISGYKVYKNGGLLATLANVTTYNVTGLSTTTQYTFTVYAYDAVGNVSLVSNTLIFTTPDTTVPTTPTNLATGSYTSSSVSLTWTGSTDNVGIYGYKVYRDGVLLTILGNVTAYNATGLTQGTQYTFTVYAYDAAGNVSLVSNSVTYTTPDTTAPSAPTNLATSSISGSTATLTWTAATDNAAVTGYYLYNTIAAATVNCYSYTYGPSYTSGTIQWINCDGSNGSIFVNSGAYHNIPCMRQGTGTGFGTWSQGSACGTAPTTQSVLFATLGNVTTYDLTGLSQVTQYTFTVYARDLIGNVSTVSNTLTFTTTDTTAPSAPTNLVASSITTTTATLNWTGSTDNVGISSYKVYRNGILFTNLGNVTTYSITGLSQSTQYTFTVYAYDTAGNISLVSNSVTFSTLTVVADTTAPSTIVTLTADQKTSDGFRVYWTRPTDNIGIAGFKIKLGTSPSNGVLYDTITSDMVDYYFGGLNPATAYTIGVAAYDAAGNIATYKNTSATTLGITCLVEGTLITLHDGTQVLIETLQVNDSLLSLAIDSLPLYSDDETVLNTWSSSLITGSMSTANVVAIQPVLVDTVININNLITSTPEHRHLIKTDNIWSFKKTSDIVIGDIMLDINNNEIIINSIETQNSSVTVYKLDVENLDIFYANGILTHNIKAQ